MWAFALALGILMWLWSGIGALLVRQLAGSAEYLVRVVWLAVVLAAGAAGLLALAWLELPDAYVSHGWTREAVERAQQLSAVLVLATAILGFVAGRHRMALASHVPTQRSAPQRRNKRR